MGSLFRRQNGIWYAAFYKEGKRPWRSLGTKDHDEAKLRFDDMARSFVSWRRMTISEFLECLKVEVLPGSLKQSSITVYDQALSAFARTVGNKLITGVTAYDAERFKVERLKEAKPATVAKEFRTLKAAFERASRFKMVKENPFAHSSSVRTPREKPAYLTMADFRRLISVVKSREMRDIIILAVHTAMRLGEIVHLRWDQVDLTSRFVHLENQSDFELKSGQPRSVPLHPDVHRVLSELPRRSEYVFADTGGGILPWRRVSRTFKQCVRKARLPEIIHFHSLRHTGITWFIQNGLPLSYVKEIAGHSSITTTMIYAHTSPEHLRESVSRLPSFLSN